MLSLRIEEEQLYGRVATRVVLGIALASGGYENISLYNGELACAVALINGIERVVVYPADRGGL